MGGMQSILGMLPGMGKIKKQMAGMNMDDRVFKQQEAIISSMTRLERAKPAIIKASRKKRIAAGSGTGVPQVNQLLKMHKHMAGMMKKMGRGGRKGMMNALGGMGGGMPPGMGGMGMPPGGMDPSALKDLGGGLPGLPKKK